MSSAIASIKYLLSERGRRESLKNGGDGRGVQEAVGVVENNADLDAFTVNEDGQASFDMTELHGCDANFNPGILPPARKGRFDEGAIRWDIVPTWSDLLDVVRGFKTEIDDMEASYEAHQAHLGRVAQQFMDDPTARATRVGKGSAVIADEGFYGDHPVIAEAHRRANSDVEEAKKRNRATLAGWINENGTQNQRQRVAAGLLPWQEAYESVEEHLFKSLSQFPLYTRFNPSEVSCQCPGELSCTPKFQSVDATELSADEWDQFTTIKAAAPGAAFQLREHRAQCLSSPTPSLVRRGVIVKLTIGQLVFKREFALIDEVPF